MNRLYSIDVLRGLALAGMILVNNPGSWSDIYTPFEHAPFAGLTLADLVFPTFMFVMGLCIPLSLKKYGFKPSREGGVRILRRTVVIFGIGLLLQWMSRGWCDWSQLRIPGVLQRLALCYGLCATMVLVAKRLVNLPVIVLTLVAYMLLLYYNQGHEWSEANIIARVDHFLLGPGHLYVDEGIRLDPEGLLSTLPSLVQVMLGAYFMLLFMGEVKEKTFVWRKSASQPDKEQSTDFASLPHEARQKKAIKYLLVYAFTVILIAVALHVSGFPIIKKVWSSSFVLVTTGIASALLACFIWLFDIKQKQGWWSQWLVIFGRNPLLLYVISWILADWFGAWGVTWRTFQWLTGWCSPCMASLIYAVLFVLVNWLIAFGLYKGKVRISA